MATGGKSDETKGGALNALRASAEGALKKLAPKASTAQPAAEPVEPDQLAFSDPTKTLFPAANMGDEQADELKFPLDERLAGSADSVNRREAMLRESAIDLKNISDARAGGEKSLTIWGFRFLIAAVWLGLGFWLYQSALYARANEMATAFGGVAVADAAPLAYAFVFTGVAGAAAAILMIAYVFLSGNATNGRLRNHAETFGDRLAHEARALNGSLKRYRDKVVSSADRNDGVSAASQAHLAALEASYFFRNISFLTTVDHEAADVAYQRFLKRYCPPAAGFGLAEVMIIGVFGVLLGLAAGWKIFSADAGPGGLADGAETSAIAIMQYPWAAQILVFGGLAYVVTGLVIEMLSGLVGSSEMMKARKDALDSMRSAYTAQEAPLESEVIRQVEDVVAILAARLGVGKSATANHSADFAEENDAPEWRRRDSSVKFVETRFAGAPERWRTDAYAKKFDASKPGEPGSKREPKRP